MAFWKKKGTDEEIGGGPTIPTAGAEPSAVIGTAPQSILADVLSAPPEEPVALGSAVTGDIQSAAPRLPLDQRFGKLRSALSEGTVIQGRLSFDTPVRIDGKLTGQVFSTDALIVGPKGSMNAEIEVSTLIVLGSVKGKIIVRDRLEIAAGGSVEGEIATPVLVLEEGGALEAVCKMTKREATQLSAVDERQAAVDEAESLAEEARVH